MNPVWGYIAGGVTLLLLLTFIGIWIWAWLPGHKKAFRAMSKIPMQDDDDAPTGEDGENKS